jgi:hypothetical protein
LEDLPGLFSKLSDAFDTHAVLVQSKKREGWWNQACSDTKQAFRASRTDADKAVWYRTMKRARTTFFNRKVAEAGNSDDIWGLLKWKQPRPAPKYIVRIGKRMLRLLTPGPLLPRENDLPVTRHA